MYQRFSSMLFGEIDGAERESQELEISEKEDEEWILVDYIDTCTNCSREETDGMDRATSPNSAMFSSSTSSLELLGNSSDPCFLQLDSCALEESWFITPPPCFTAGGQAPVQVEMSPMENLLIEHPSMSVYTVHNIHSSLRENSRSVEYENPTVRTESPARVSHHIRCYAAALAAHTSFLEQANQIRHSQRAKEHLEKHLLNRNNIRRQNLIRESSSRQTKHSGHVLHQPCQRQYN
ncbi:tumor protein p53-inducible nuclear protein 1 [Callorhinchus milii]|uniref:Tumor protein p53 inducible nuclear protein 1 n=1 Tax=Callorhinchus milii TaxID=7868 RepID=V9L479_CALMI|nr:tumor protein p53-inducible nuclear protein 1 [Callorhinchus milii]|eukprot:gi/632941863/ref/XP_007886102.1/ PREDICTED: tumor protein p53-inducible nuclear protein 1 isoform X1 [Callorhinchus milii]